MRKCKKCEFLCTLIRYHEGECTCNTDHICIQECSICRNKVRCSLQNGHKNKHFCQILSHKCTENCSIMNCNKACTFDPGHEDACRCSGSHPCGEKCKMYAYCGQLCQVDLTISHKDHDCGGKKCPLLCFFSCGKECSNLNHFHDEILEPQSIDTYKSSKIHLCGSTHTCSHECRSDGICSIKTTSCVRTFRNKYNEFYYQYVDLVPEKKPCKHRIEIGNINHVEDDHICSTGNHTCNQRCPDCNAFCDLEIGHEGLHHSGSHRNKECSEYISLTETFEDVHVEDGKSTAITIIAGENAAPEFCDQYCLRKKRGHTHPMPCKGGELCLEKKERGYAIHSESKYISKKKYESCQYDLVSCDTY